MGAVTVLRSTFTCTSRGKVSITHDVVFAVIRIITDIYIFLLPYIRTTIIIIIIIITTIITIITNMFRILGRSPWRLVRTVCERQRT